jgi:uroporphyrinogen decarboxylase
MKDKSQITSYERMMMALEGKRPDRPPVFPMVRDWAIRQAGFRVSEVIQDVAKHVYTQFYCLKRFGYDGVRDLSAIHAESEAMGSRLKIPDDGAPSVVDFAVKDYDRDLAKLKIPNPWKDGRLPMILEGIKNLKGMCAKQVPVVAYIQAPFRHASMLRGSDEIMKDTYKRPGKVKDLLEITTVSQIVYGIACVHAGADIIFISDPTSSGDAISVKTWEEFGLPYTTRVVQAVKKTGVKMIMHICGDTSDRLESLTRTGVDCLSLDSKVDFGYARKVLGEDFPLMGNVDPTYSLPFKKPEEVEEESREVINKAGMSGGLILSSGCSVPAMTPPENIEAMVRAAKEGY